MEMTMDKRMIAVASRKGGVGKTAMACALVGTLRASGRAVAAWDGDGGVGGLLKTFGSRDSAGRLLPDQDPLAGVGYYDIRSESERLGLINSVASGDSLIVHDLAGGSLGDACQVVDDGDVVMSAFLDTLDARGYRLTVAHVLSSSIEAAASVGAWLSALPPDRCDHVGVLNRHFGRSIVDFPFWNGFVDTNGSQRGGANRRRLLESGGAEIFLPALPPTTFSVLDLHHVPVTAGAGCQHLTVAEQAHSARFCRDFSAQIGAVGERLGWTV